jgi:KaiC/GvpD/RAD55 family RecA-like ATPase
MGVAMGDVHWTTMSEIQSKPVQWLWEGRVPCGKVTLLDGEPGSGKTLLALDLAARVSRGAAMPLSRHRPKAAANVVIFNDDDNLADTLRPRLEEAGADLSHVHVIDGEVSSADVAPLAPALIVVDPLSAYLCLESSAPPRSILKRLARLARESSAAVLAVQYLPKEGFWAGEIYDAARSVLLVSIIGNGRNRISVAKSNLQALVELSPYVFHLDQTDDGGVRITGWADSV